MMEKPRMLISACLLGVDCRYDGGGKALTQLGDLMDRYELVPVCPEQLGGMSTPRPPSERSGDRIVNREGADVTAAFLRGAEQTCRIAALFGTRLALLKARSPSCGRGQIYDGSFTGALTEGDGVATQALIALGVRVFTEEELEVLLGGRP